VSQTKTARKPLLGPQLPPDPSDFAPPPTGSVVIRSDGRVLKRTTLYLEFGLARRLAIFAAGGDKDQSELVNDAVRELLDRLGAP